MKHALAIVAILSIASPAWAHKPSDSHVRIAVDGTTVSGRIDVALRDLDNAIALDGDGDGEISWGEVMTSAPRISAYVEQRLAIADAGSPDVACTLVLAPAALIDLSDGAYYALPFTARCATAPAALAITYRLLFDVDAQHRGLVHLDGQTLIIRDATPVHAELGAATSIPAFVYEGIWHIWKGFDHVLFLLCLILPAVFPRRGAPLVALGKLVPAVPPRRKASFQPAESLRDVAKEVFEIVTAFTLAHSITLVISTVGLVSLPSRFIETAIALSVLAAALNNLLRAIDARWAVAFALGLLHGFGFSSVLIDLGLPSGELIGSLLGFNLGVELGQAAIVLVTIPLLYWIRRTVAYQALYWVGSFAVTVIAGLWTYQRWFA